MGFKRDKLGKFLRLEKFIKGFTGLISDPEDDFFDRISCALSVWILLICAMWAGGEFAFTDPMHCMYRKETPGTYSNYMADICFTDGSYAQEAIRDPMLKIYEEALAYENKIGYYQWVPYVLFLQALLFLVPKKLWQFLIHIHSFDYITAIKDADTLEDLYEEKNREHLKNLVVHIMKQCDALKHRKTGLLGRTLVLSNIVVKWLYVVNACGQFWFLSRFVGGGRGLAWGLEAVLRLHRDMRSYVFPIEASCRVKLFEDSNWNEHVMQCLLPWNMYHEKIFIFLWFWLIFVAVMSFLSALYTTGWYFFPQRKGHFMATLLLASPRVYTKNLDETAVSTFAVDKIGADGLLLLSFIKERCGTIIAGQMAYELWIQIHEVMEETNSTF
ncbi:hypothetical protein L596_006800 [Steinernema carpocapsae]|uniref:Innexin n=1 Tax=Steinernema carpocapsae TaxID=34508 RepID=A0A4U5P898_STECR|nr:hypothetical protein L596_006800 [Steinernema carpocapsae]